MLSFPHGIMFHHFYDDTHLKGQGAISEETFEQMLLSVGIENILTPDEWIEKFESRTLTENNRCLTFDDCLRCQFDIALPVLEKYNLKAFWFIYTSIFDGVLERLEIYRKFRNTVYRDIDEFYFLFLEKTKKMMEDKNIKKTINDFNPSQYKQEFPFYSDNDRLFRYLRDEVMTCEEYHQVMESMIESKGIDLLDFSKDLWMTKGQIQHLANSGHHVGLHTHTHPTTLILLTEKEQEEEYRKNDLKIRDATGVKPTVASHPCCSYCSKTFDILKDLKIKLAFRSNMDKPFSYDNPYELPRKDHAVLKKEVLGD